MEFQRTNAALTTTPDSMAPHVSVENQLPEDLYDAMGRFIADHPQWDQYRLVQSRHRRLPVSTGEPERVVAQHYLKGLFHRTEPCARTSGRQT